MFFLSAPLSLIIDITADAQGCTLTNKYVRETILQYVAEQRAETKTTVEKNFRFRITLKSKEAWSVVVSPLPITPDSYRVFDVSCESPFVREVEAGPPPPPHQ